MPKTFKTNNKPQKTPNALGTAVWAAVFGSSTVTTLDTLTDTTINSDWLRYLSIILTATIAVGSAYKMMKSVNDQNKYMNNQNQR